MDKERCAAWQIEERSLGEGLTADTFDMADCVELPSELCAHAEAADADLTHADDFDEWLTYLSESALFLAVEQSCDADGLLLAWDMRAVRLQTLPSALLGKLHFFFEQCPRHTRALLAHYVFWLVRFERISRRGSPVWRVEDTVIEAEEDPAFFRPNRLTIRRQGH